MDKSIKLIQTTFVQTTAVKNSKFKIQHLITPILFFLLLSCSSPTETPNGLLSGTVNLEGLSDHSGIIVAVYDLATLDPYIVSINQQYPHIGVIITQHTEFDHRLQEPVKYTETDAEGYFEVKEIPTGTYNIVAIRDSFGFKYIYEINIQDGENELSNSQFLMLNSQLNSKFKIQNSKLVVRSADIILYPETPFSGYFEETSTTFYTDHHYIIEDDTVLLPDQSLTIEPGAVIRIEPGKDFTIHGTLTAQGEENNMFWITSNHGFEVNAELLMFNSQLNSKFKIQNSTLPNRIGEIELYNSMELSSIVTVESDLVEWGKFDYANTCLLNQINNLHMQNGIFRNGNCGFYSTLNPAEDDSTFCSNILCKNIIDEGKGGLFIEYSEKGNISNNILINNSCGALVKDRFMDYIENNYFTENSVGLSLWHFLGNVSHNELNNNDIDIIFTGNMNPSEIDGVNIEYNNLYSDIAIYHFQFLTYAYQYYSGIHINNNNFENNQWFLQYHSRMMNDDIDATSNYFDGLYTEIEINNRIIDNWETGTIQVLIEPWLINKVSNAGIQ